MIRADAVARPAALGRDARLAPAEAELQVVPALEHVALERDVVLRPQRLEPAVRPVIHGRVVAIRLDVAAAARLEREPVLGVRVAADEEQVGPERLVDLDLVQVGRAVLVVGRLVGTEARRAAAELLLVAAEVGEVGARLRRQLAGDLGRDVLEERRVPRDLLVVVERRGRS